MSRLMQWAAWLGSVTALIIVIFGVLLGRSYYDVRTDVTKGKTQIQDAVQQGRTDIDGSVRQGLADIDRVREAVPDLQSQVETIQGDLNKYKKATDDIGTLRKQVDELKIQVFDFGQRDVRARTFTATGVGGPSSLSFPTLGCPPVTVAESGVSFCAKGSPPSLYQFVLATHDLRPVASLSDVGFQDSSSTPKPNCTTARRGTFFVEKGSANVADKPFVCVKGTGNGYGWIQLSAAPE
jgi:hypothetical protein